MREFLTIFAVRFLAVMVWACGSVDSIRSAESIWIEAEHLNGVRGYCWPTGRPEMKKTAGHWGLSGPGWAAEWSQGGESGFLSIACGADDDKASATTKVDIPVAGSYRVWVRFRENRELTNRFQLVISGGGKSATLQYGEKPNVEEDNEMKLYWNWAFAWEGHDVELTAGTAVLELRSAVREKECRQIDCIVLTTDKSYRPLIKDRPNHPLRTLLEDYRTGKTAPAESLIRRHAGTAVPAEWTPKTFRDQGFLYLWNMNSYKWSDSAANRVPVPYHVGDKAVREAFEKKYAGATDVPIFSDPRIVPVLYGPGPYRLQTTGKDGKPDTESAAFLKWLEASPDRKFAHLINYAPDTPVTESGRTHFDKHRDRFVGYVSGENLGYFNIPADRLKGLTAGARNRRELAEAMTIACKEANGTKYRTVFGREMPDAYREVIPCQSVMMTAWAPLTYRWGARTVGYESSVITGGLQSMRMAFLRGAARQHGGLTATYRSSNFGDSATMFSEQQAYPLPKNILDNYYSVFSGAGMTWYKFDVWHQYMSGASMFYHEQGFDEYWMPGGTTAAGTHDVQLSPKGKIVDRFLRTTRAYPDRGTPYTPVAFLLDYAHGWDPSPYAPHAFDDFGKRPELTRYADHERMLHEYFWTAYHPIGAKAETPVTATSENFVAGMHGDVFDVVFAYPEVERWKGLKNYSALVAAGDLPLTAAERAELLRYVDQGGTLIVADGQFDAETAKALGIPVDGPSAESAGYRWVPGNSARPSQRFRYRPITTGKPLATTDDGKAIASAMDRGQGRIIVISIPRALGIDKSAHPVLADILSGLTHRAMPVRIEGDVEWMVNRTKNGWLVTLFNPAGQNKPQQGISPTDYRENRSVMIRTVQPIRSAMDRLAPTDRPEIREDGRAVPLTVSAGSVRLIELIDR